MLRPDPLPADKWRPHHLSRVIEEMITPDQTIKSGGAPPARSTIHSVDSTGEYCVSCLSRQDVYWDMRGVREYGDNYQHA